MVQGKYPPPILHIRILGLSKIKLLTYIQRVYNACPNFSLPHSPYPNPKPLHPQRNKTYCMFFTDKFLFQVFDIWLNLWIHSFSECLQVGALQVLWKCVLGIKTLTWPSPPRTMNDCPRLPLSSAIIMIIILSRGLRIKKKVFASQNLYWTLLEGLCQNSPLLPH